MSHEITSWEIGSTVLPDAQTRGPSRRVVGRVRLALPLGDRPLRRIPRIRAQARGVVDGQAGVIADLGTGTPLGQLLVEALRPHPGEIHLCARRGARTERDQRDDDGNGCDGWRHFHLASGSGRNWNFTTELSVPLPPSVCHTEFGP